MKYSATLSHNIECSHLVNYLMQTAVK